MTQDETEGGMSGLPLLARNLRNLIRAPRALAAVDRRYGKGVAHRKALRRLAFYPGLGLGFNRIKKNANSALILLLHELETGQSTLSDQAKDAAVKLFELSPADLVRFDDFAVFVTIRNPYSRVLSAFLDKFRFDEYRRKHGDFPLTPDGFGAFLDWLDAGGLSRDAHWDRQVRLLALPLDRYDAVLRFETLRADAVAFLNARGLALPEDALGGEHKGDKGKQTGADRQLGSFYTPARAALVARLYAEDFTALGYDPEDRPHQESPSEEHP
ncbi:sulfotransferase family 2 domain-containing protein [Pararhodobacter marinus]|uniref:sulfotransferase family 2 domain-containing protein n=1 Tax=Pararhodobacter marinus TaxID=2184063 RepID=UPI0035196830